MQSPRSILIFLGINFVFCFLFPRSWGAAPGPTGTVFKPSGAVTVTSGQTVTGLSISNPSGPCIQGTGVSNVHIYNNKIGPCGPLASHPGILIQRNAHDITVEHNSFDDVAGGMLINGGTNNIIFDHNYI